jgi:hypothetical protein
LKAGLGVGLVVAVLAPLALFLFGVLSPLQSISALLLLSGLWILIFGAFLARQDRMTYGGWGLVVALLATFILLPLQYTAGLVVVGIIALILVWVFARPRTKSRSQPVSSGTS